MFLLKGCLNQELFGKQLQECIHNCRSSIRLHVAEAMLSIDMITLHGHPKNDFDSPPLLC